MFKIEIKHNTQARKMILKGKNIGQVIIWAGAIESESKDEIILERIARKPINFSNCNSKIESNTYDFANSFELFTKDYYYEINYVGFKIEKYEPATAPMAISVLHF
jgi:hypothetical protein